MATPAKYVSPQDWVRGVSTAALERARDDLLLLDDENPGVMSGLNLIGEELERRKDAALEEARAAGAVVSRDPLGDLKCDA